MPNRGSGLDQIRFIDPKAQAEIERLQPYHLGNAFDQDPLWRLQELNNIDKHRVVHVAATVSTGTSLGPDARSVNFAGFKLGELQALGGALEGRTQILRLTGTLIPVVPGQPVRMNPFAVLEVVFDPATPLVGSAPVAPILDNMNDHIVSAVLPPLVGFLK